MKFLSFILLISSFSIFSMELDQTALEEFIANKKQMVTVSEGKINNPEDNLLFQTYARLSKLNTQSAAQEYANPTLQEKVKSFYELISNNPAYKTAHERAKTANTQEAWDAFRKGNGPLVQQYFEQNGIAPVSTSCADFFNANAKLSPEQVEKVVAQSIGIYVIRKEQRKQTEIAPSVIQIK